jgi:small conductance mechanosensitive channel
MDTTANQVSQWGDKLITYLIENGPKLLGALAILIAGFLVARAIGKIVENWLNKKDMEPPVRMLIGRIVRLVIIAFALIIALGTCGVDIAPMVAGIGVAGVGVGLAMQGVLGNLISGLVIIFTKPFRVGEYIEIIGCNGQVTTIELFSTVLAHPDRSRVIIPNRKIVGEVLHNYGVIRQHNIKIGVAYDTNLPEAIAAIRGILDQNSKILKEPAPVVAVGSFGDSAIEIGINPWSQLSEFGGASAELKLAIVEAFRARRIEIPFPQREVRVLNGKMLS